jgi:endonuclease/exonuclease/phosphatase family metal-dependent hydrolase
MNQPVRKFSKYIVYSITDIIGIGVIIVAGFLIFATVTDYKPAEKESLPIVNTGFPDTVPVGQLDFYTWNIGYCGLGEKMDFFYEGGIMVRPEKGYYEICRNGVFRQIKSFSNPDFIFIQEVDQHSARTYYDDQVAEFDTAFKNYEQFFALNYKVPFVPVPLHSPMGKVVAGLLTLSHYKPVEASRYSFPSAYSWPKRLFMLDRGFILTRYTVSNGKQMVLVNTHNSAFDDAADMRIKELNLLKKIIEKEYKLGNYVIVGGDWNQNPVPFNMDSIQDGNATHLITPGIPDDFLPAGFKWAFDPNHPTNRDVNQPYTIGVTKTTVIDFFVLSPNINLISANVVQNNFEYSDHQPLRMVVELK